MAAAVALLTSMTGWSMELRKLLVPGDPGTTVAVPARFVMPVALEETIVTAAVAGAGA